MERKQSKEKLYWTNFRMEEVTALVFMICPNSRDQINLP